MIYIMLQHDKDKNYGMNGNSILKFLDSISRLKDAVTGNTKNQSLLCKRCLCLYIRISLEADVEPMRIVPLLPA